MKQFLPLFVLLYVLFKEEIVWAVSQIPLPAKIIIAVALLGYFTYQAIKEKQPPKVPPEE